jgi:SAM-dependent methyltransferase
MENKDIINNINLKEVYNKIAEYFNITRVRIWGSVKNFLNSLDEKSSILDVGCGNGKNMLYRPNLKFKGIDFSEEQVKICKHKNLDVIEASMCSLPFDDSTFDHMICIASYHHLDNDKNRQESLNEMYRCLKKNGKVLITVWAMEQFEGSTFNFTKKDEMVSWRRNGDDNIYYRYYHIYNKGDLEEEVMRLEPRFKIVGGGWEVGNWFIILQK